MTFRAAQDWATESLTAFTWAGRLHCTLGELEQSRGIAGRSGAGALLLVAAICCSLTINARSRRVSAQHAANCRPNQADIALDVPRSGHHGKGEGPAGPAADRYAEMVRLPGCRLRLNADPPATQ